MYLDFEKILYSAIELKRTGYIISKKINRSLHISIICCYICKTKQDQQNPHIHKALVNVFFSVGLKKQLYSLAAFHSVWVGCITLSQLSYEMMGADSVES